MQKGGKYKIHIPGALAYGETRPRAARFGPNADLDFDVHIVQIVPNAALMQQQGGQAPGGEGRCRIRAASRSRLRSRPRRPSGGGFRRRPRLPRLRQPAGRG